MDAHDFLSLAIRLSASPLEAEARTAVSRAYYGVFHLAQAFVCERCGVATPIDQSHAKLSLCLRNAGHPTADKAGSKLDTLRSARRVADYRLNDPLPRKRDWVQMQLGEMRRFVDALTECSAAAAFPTIADGIRHYAEHVLRLPVRDAP